MTTLFTASLELARILGNVLNSTTTGAGSATTIVDSARTERDDYWNNGTIWIKGGTHAGKSRKVSDFAQSGGTFTIPTTSTAVGSGIAYSLLSADWPLDKLWEFINRALRSIGDIPQLDTTLTTVANQEAYTLPSGVYNVQRVEIATSKTSPYYYRPWHGVWREENGYLYFNSLREPDSAGYIMRLTYAGQHAEMDADDDTISNYVHLDRLIWNAAVHAWRWRIQMSKEDDKMFQQFLAEAIARAKEEDGKHPIHMPVRGIRTSL